MTGSGDSSATPRSVRMTLAELLKGEIAKQGLSYQDVAELASTSSAQISVSTVKNAVAGTAGLDRYIAIFRALLKLSDEELEQLILDFMVFLRKENPTASDREAAKINIPEPQRYRLFSAMYSALRIVADSGFEDK